MIGILSNRLTDDFIEKLGLSYEFIDKFNPEENRNFDCLFIDWVPKISGNEVACLKQASLLQKYIRTNIPIIIYDRKMSMTENETSWCKKFNTYLFEPYLNSGRKEFEYLPEWVENLEVLIKDDEDRDFDVVYSRYKIEDVWKEFNKWIKQYAAFFCDRKVSCFISVLPEFKENELKESNLDLTVGQMYNAGNFTVALDDDNSYKCGNLNQTFLWAMNLGCLPLLPVGHKYFHSMFKGLIIENIKEMDFYISSFYKIRYELIEEIFDRIKNTWSEFTSNHVIDVIKRCLE